MKEQLAADLSEGQVAGVREKTGFARLAAGGSRVRTLRPAAESGIFGGRASVGGMSKDPMLIAPPASIRLTAQLSSARRLAPGELPHGWDSRQRRVDWRLEKSKPLGTEEDRLVAFWMRMAEHREPDDLRESRTVLGARGVRFLRATRQVVLKITGVKRSRRLSLNRRYQRTHRMMTSRSKCHLRQLRYRLQLAHPRPQPAQHVNVADRAPSFATELEFLPRARTLTRAGLTTACYVNGHPICLLSEYAGRGQRALPLLPALDA
jgi:hypothetical protein